MAKEVAEFEAQVQAAAEELKTDLARLVKQPKRKHNALVRLK